MNASLRCALAALLLTSIVPATAMPSTLNARIEAQREKAAAARAQLQAKQYELHTATVRVTNLQAQLDRTTSAISGVDAHLRDLAAQQHSTQLKLQWNTLQLDAAEKSLKLQDDLLAHRLVDIYEHGNLGYLNVLLASKSFSDFVERWEDLRLLVAANEDAVRQRKAAAEKVATLQQSLESAQQALQGQELAQQRARNQLDTLAAERSNLVAVADAERRHVAGEVAHMEDISATQEAQLEQLIVERQREIAAQQEAERRAEGIAGAPSAPGRLSWPVSGTITSPFGYRRNPFGGGMEFHQGLDIAAPMGTTITAAASGTVIQAGWFGGYGNYILIDNGGGMSTGYGHCSQIFVTVGQKVQRGQAIGAVGSTGYSTGPHVHFEVRINGKPVDPAPYLH